VKLINDIRSLIGTLEIRRKLRKVKRKKCIHNFTTARSAGILFSCRQEAEFGAVKEFKQFLESEAIDTAVLGYVDDQEVPDQFLLRKGFQFFCQKDLKWSKVPGVLFVHEFTKKPFDILFDLSLEDHFPLQYVLRLSPASYKIGRLVNHREYDLMIDIEKESSVAYLIEQIRHYLSIIHTRNP
jgi:hypothetical protein